LISRNSRGWRRNERKEAKIGGSTNSKEESTRSNITETIDDTEGILYTSLDKNREGISTGTAGGEGGRRRRGREETGQVADEKNKRDYMDARREAHQLNVGHFHFLELEGELLVLLLSADEELDELLLRFAFHGLGSQILERHPASITCTGAEDERKA